ncbi:FkbM family methyltransferase [Roseibium sp. Sym1]|uniref:FkbM family methyltransferase n=1 Tax=Roseibium sp. Sym1 TaxID=3016006 RepID=UPI0022B58502|nr:FkbM family methyltransferase [Roseibium sp. Sym1]
MAQRKTQQVNGVFLPAADTHFADHLLSGPLFRSKGTYQYSKIEKALEVLKARNSKMRHALDIGAHVGLWSMVIAEYFESVVAFEPVPEHVHCYRLNTADFSNVKLHKTVLGAKSGKANVISTPENTGNAFVRDGGVGGVRMRKLDSFNFKDIDFVKIDVEGFEYFVIQGGEHLLKRDKPVMVIEQKKGNAERYGLEQTAAVKLLESWGAVVQWRKSGDFCLAWNK